MLGYNQSEILARITQGGFGLPENVRGETREQSDARQQTKQALDRLAHGVARAIEANNEKMEEDLRKAGVTLENEGLPSN